MCARASAQGALLRPTERAAARAHGAHCNRTAPPRKVLRTLTAPHSYSRAAHPRAKRKLADLGRKTVTVAGQHSQHAADAEQTRAQKCRRRAPARAGGGWLATQVCVAIHHAQQPADIGRRRAGRQWQRRGGRRAMQGIARAAGDLTNPAAAPHKNLCGPTASSVEHRRVA